MNTELLNKFVGDKRTATKQLGNIVNLSYSSENSGTELAYKAIADLAEKHQNFKISNEKNQLLIKIADMDNEFQSKYLNDPTIYTDQDKFEGMVTAYNNELIKSKRELILGSQYLSQSDVDKMIGSQKIVDGEKLNNLQYKRNQMFIKETYDTALLTRQQLETIGSNLDPSQTEMFNEVLNGLNETAKALETTGMSKTKIAAMIGESVANMEYSRDNKEILAIVNNPNMSFDDKMSTINKYKKNAMSDDYLNQISGVYNDKFKFDEESQKAFKQSFMVRGSQTQAGNDRELEAIERMAITQEKNRIDALKQIEKDKKDALTTEEAIRKAINDNDPYKFIEAKYDVVPTTKELVQDNLLLEETFNTSLVEIGDSTNRDVANVIASGDLKRIKQEISAYATDGRTQDEIINEVIYPFANEMAGNDDYARNAILKNLGMQLRGYSPTLLLKAPTRPNMAKTNEAYTYGKNIKTEVEVKAPNWLDETLTRDNVRTRYFQLSNAVGSTPTAKEKLNTLLLGKMKQAGYTKYTPIDVESFIEDDNNFNDIRNSLQDLMDLQIAPINYRYKNIRTDTLKGSGESGGTNNDFGFTGIKRK